MKYLIILVSLFYIGCFSSKEVRHYESKRTHMVRAYVEQMKLLEARYKRCPMRLTYEVD